MKKIEIYSKQWCPYCLKAKSLLKSKGLSYEDIDVTEDMAQKQEMIARSGRRTVPQIFIDGEAMGGYDDISQLNATGELDKMLGIDMAEQHAKIYDVVIIGAGPAGLSAAIYASRKNISTLLIALDIGGQMGTTYDIANYPGIKQISGPDLVEQFMAHVDQYNVEKLIGERVNGIGIKDHHKVVKTESGKEILAKAVIITTGAFKRKLDIPGEKELTGKGVVYCSTCDGPLFKDLSIAIVGGGNSGLEAALEMENIASKVYLISGGEWRGDQILQDKVAANQEIEVLKFHRPVEIHGTQHVEGITLKNVRTNETRYLDVRGVFIEVGLFPNTDFALDLMETNRRGEIKVNNEGDTGVRGIFAAGDVTDKRDKQIVIAAGDGARAALTAFNYIMTQI